MRSLDWSHRHMLAALAFVACLLAMPLQAEEKSSEGRAWQEVISGQIQAFRDHDAPTAFNYAGAAFKISFQNADVFFEAIIRSGYGPIVASSSHSFGDYRMIGELVVLQRVTLLGGDLRFYEAIYQLVEEPDGWRVQGVQLFLQPGMAT
jgi:hypothetical protein